MTKPPKSKIAIVLYVVAFFFACGCAVALYQFVKLPGDSLQGTAEKIGMLEAVRYSGITALSTFVLGYVVQMIVDIRWKLFESETNA